VFEIIFLVLFTVVLLFSFVILFGAPYLPTTKVQVSAALDLLGLKKDQTLLELGAGDGSVSLAALRCGLKVTAIELNPILCVVIFFRTFSYRSKITITCGNFWRVEWGSYDGVYVFLLDKYMKRLDNKLIHEHFVGKLASFAFQIPSKKHALEKSGIYLYKYTTRPPDY